jgi:hypothetical protein
LANHPDVLGHPDGAAEKKSVPPQPKASSPKLVWLQGPANWLMRKAQSVARRVAAGLVNLVLPPQPFTTAGVTRSTILSASEAIFNLLTTYVFIRCTGGASRATPASRDDPDLPITEESVLRALLALMRALDRESPDAETLRDLAEELHQRLDGAGYAWEALPEGTQFQDDHRECFHTFGLVAPGDPIETLEPCFRRGEIVLLPGRITKKRG